MVPASVSAGIVLVCLARTQQAALACTVYSPRWFGFHEVFHALTVAAFTAHYIAISLAVY